MSEKKRRGMDWGGRLWPVWLVQGMAVVFGAGAVGMPWVAGWVGAIGVEEGSVLQLRPELVELPGGVFMMGSPEGEKNRGEDETQHPMEVEPFLICRTEVTLGQWEAVMGTRPNDCRYGCENEHPVQNVSWEDAIRYMNALTELENQTLSEGKKLKPCYAQEQGKWVWEDRKCTGYRLPTEAEWEYAARAGTKTAYSFGDDEKELCKYGNGADASAKRKHSEWSWALDGCDDSYADLAPVGKFKANLWGLYDMHGNVWEWVWDWYAPYPENAKAGYGGPETMTDGFRVLRGGSFDYGPWGLRSSYRSRVWPSFRYWYYGFRCVRGSPQQ